MFSSEVSAAAAGVPAIVIHDDIAVVQLLLAPLFHYITAVAAWLPSLMQSLLLLVSRTRRKSLVGVWRLLDKQNRGFIYRANVEGRKGNCSLPFQRNLNQPITAEKIV